MTTRYYRGAWEGQSCAEKGGGEAERHNDLSLLRVR